MPREKKHFWTIETSDGTHEIKVIRGFNLRRNTVDPIEIYVDCAQVAALQPSGGKMITKMECDFPCGDETVKLILHGRDVDIVHRGILVGSKREYKPQEKLPFAVSIILMLLTLSALAGIPWLNSIVPFEPSITVYFVAVMVIALWVFLTLESITSPIKSNARKVIIGIINSICSWLVMAVIMYFPTALLLTWVAVFGY